MSPFPLLSLDHTLTLSTIAFGFNLFLLAKDQSLEFYQGWWIRGLVMFEVGLAGPVEVGPVSCTCGSGISKQGAC